MSRFESLEFEDAPRSRAKAPPGKPVHDAAYFQQVADNEFRIGHLESALRNYSRALEQDSTVFACWLGQVRVLIELAEYKEAVIWSDKALEMFPDHPELLAVKAVACVRTGDLQKAMAYTDNALLQKGATPYVWLARAEVLLAERSKMARHCFTQGLARCGNVDDKARLHLGIANLLRRYRHYTDALPHAKEAVEALPSDPAAWLELGLCQGALGLGDAGFSLEQALALNPACEEARQTLTASDQGGFGRRVRAWFRRLLGR